MSIFPLKSSPLYVHSRNNKRKFIHVTLLYKILQRTLPYLRIMCKLFTWFIKPHTLWPHATSLSFWILTLT